MAKLSGTARLARISSLHPWRMVGVWVALLVIFGVVQGVAPMKTTTDVNLLNNPESDRGWDLLDEHGIRAGALRHRDRRSSGRRRRRSTIPPSKQTVQRVTDALRADPEIVASATNYYEVSAQDPNAAAGLVSADKRTTIIPVTLVGSLEDAVENGADFLALIHGQRAAAGRTSSS